MVKKALGRGLSALIPQKEEVFGENIINIPPHQIQANPAQPRKVFDEDKLRELASSLEKHGMVQPLIVTPIEADEDGEVRYELIAGERRWRAAQRVGLTEIPCIVRAMSPLEATEIALIENIQRENLNAIEEAEAYRQLIDTYSYTQEDLSKRLGKSRPYITNTLRLLSLAPQYRSMLNDGRLTAGHARAILMLGKSSSQSALAKKIIDERLSVRQAEELARQYGKQKEEFGVKQKPKEQKAKKNDPIYKDIEAHLRNKFATKVTVLPRNKGGQIILDYFSLEDLDRLIEILLPEEEF